MHPGVATLLCTLATESGLLALRRLFPVVIEEPQCDKLQVIETPVDVDTWSTDVLVLFSCFIAGVGVTVVALCACCRDYGTRPTIGGGPLFQVGAVAPRVSRAGHVQTRPQRQY